MELITLGILATTFYGIIKNNHSNSDEMDTSYLDNSGLPRGLRNNNPGNIRISSAVTYNGELQPSADKSFKQFATIAYGYRAMFVLLYTYYSRYGLNTISKMISRWAPPNENNTTGYIDNVSKYSGIPKDRILTQQNGAEMQRIVAAMSRIENGVMAVDGEVRAGFLLQTNWT
jgi:hypothetical protein